MEGENMRLLNAISLGMLPGDGRLLVRWISRQDAVVLAAAQEAAGGGLESAVGHADTARLFGRLLGMAVEPNRATVVLNPGEVALVGQYQGLRLPEGATELPEGATVAWATVEWVTSLEESPVGVARQIDDLKASAAAAWSEVGRLSKLVEHLGGDPKPPCGPGIGDYED